MGQITAVLRRAGRRLGVARFIEALIVLSTGLLAACVLARLAQQIFTLNVPWLSVLMYAPGAVVALAGVYALATRAPAAVLARRVDEGADLRETLSTALAVEKSDSPWARSVVSEAQSAAARVDVRRAVPITAPRWWPSPLVAALALLVVWITVPALDVLGRAAAADAKKQDQNKIEQAKVESQQAIAKVQEAIRKIDPEAGKKADQLEIPKDAKLTPEDVRRAAVKNLTDLKAQLEAMKQGTQAQATQNALDKLKQLKTPGPGPLSELSRELSKGDFKQAGEALKQLGEKLQNSQLSEKEMEALKQQLDQMAKQLENLAKDQSALAQKMSEMGLDPKLASDPKALEAALKAGSEMSKHLTQEQKQQLQNAAKAMQQASQMCQNMSKAMQEAAAACNKSGMGQQGMQAMSDMGGQLSQMEAMAQDLASMQAGLSEANHQLSQMSGSMGQCNSPGMGAARNGMMAGTGRWGEGETQGRMGAGSGGPGQSSGGGGVGEAEAPEKFETRKFRTNTTAQGPIIGSTVVEGESVKGEAKAQFRQAVEAAENSVAQALENNLVERQYQDVVKKYFNRLQAKAGTGATAPAAPAAPAKPATDSGK